MLLINIKARKQELIQIVCKKNYIYIYIEKEHVPFQFMYNYGYILRCWSIVHGGIALLKAFGPL